MLVTESTLAAMGGAYIFQWGHVFDQQEHSYAPFDDSVKQGGHEYTHNDPWAARVYYLAFH